ncbi:MAG: hypothetical protein IPM79_36530 [Polyangiaceae bacterium]|jgi:hypothetical protein|nr:hypothetical protein [Polyangiaceae bacterium]MBK8942961.1 hypothetical protein [Polyangiaceae bacterium]
MHALGLTRATTLLATLAALSLATGCRRDPCQVDSFEANGTFEEGSDLGSFSDRETTLDLPLTLHTTDDVDVFFFNVRDEGIDGNPEIDIWVEGQDSEQLEMVLEYQCSDSEMSEFECNGERVPGEHGGLGCRVAGPGELHINVNYDCFGDNNDSGFAVLTVTRNAPPVECAAYDLEIHTD